MLKLSAPQDNRSPVGTSAIAKSAFSEDVELFTVLADELRPAMLAISHAIALSQGSAPQVSDGWPKRLRVSGAPQAQRLGGERRGCLQSALISSMISALSGKRRCAARSISRRLIMVAPV